MADAFGIRLGAPHPFIATSGFVNNFALNQSADKIAFVLQLPEGMTITRLGVRSGTLTGTSPTYKVSLQGVSATTGAPDGTILGGGTPASKTFTVSASNIWTWYTLDNSYVGTRGQLVAVVIEYSSGTIDGSNNSSFTISMSDADRFWALPGYLTNDNGAAWVKQNSDSGVMVVGIGSASKAYGYPKSALYNPVFNLNSSPDEIGMKFTLPAGWGNTFQILGGAAAIPWDAGAVADLVLYDSDGSTVLQQVSVDADQFPGQDGGTIYVYFDEATLATLNFGTTYRLTWKPTSATNWYGMFPEMAVAADFDAYPLGQNVQLTSRTDGGAWTDAATRRPLMELILADWTKPTGGGGGGASRRTPVGGF